MLARRYRESGGRGLRLAPHRDQTAKMSVGMSVRLLPNYTTTHITSQRPAYKKLTQKNI